ncbi:MAG TPA: MCE family protein, partial [Mycobacterium sp.]|nr:MCE family protein [Mycobacterium sp.]
MTRMKHVRRLIAITACVTAAATGCAFQGLNSLRLPGAVGRGTNAKIYHVEVANVGTLESNSPVMINDVVVGSVGKMTVQGWHANVEVSIRPDAVVPANAVASVGQTSLLGSMHLQLNPPLGEPARGSLQPGATIPLSKSSTYPSTEQTLSLLSIVINAGGLSQLGDIVHNFNTSVHGREQQIRDLLTRLDTFVGVLDQQRDNIIASIQALNRLAGTFADQRDALNDALNKLPPALDVLVKERPNITTALEKLGTFSDTTTRLVNDTQADLVKNLQNLEPTLKALTDLGTDLAPTLAYLPTYPFPPSLVDRGARGDYMNLFA